MMATHLERALRAAESARREREAGDFDATCNRAYYAMFYAAQGLLEAAGEDAPGKTHATTLRLFSQRLVAGGDAPPELARSLTIAQGFRSRADYTLDGVTAENADEALRAWTIYSITHKRNSVRAKG